MEVFMALPLHVFVWKRLRKESSGSLRLGKQQPALWIYSAVPHQLGAKYGRADALSPCRAKN